MKFKAKCVKMEFFSLVIRSINRKLAMPLKLILVKFDFDWGNILILTDFEHLILDLFWSKIKGFGQKYRVTA